VKKVLGKKKKLEARPGCKLEVRNPFHITVITDQAVYLETKRADVQDDDRQEGSRKIWKLAAKDGAKIGKRNWKGGKEFGQWSERTI